MKKLQHVCQKYYIYILVYFIALACVLFLLDKNEFSFIFDVNQVLEKFGDQRLYIELADKLLNGKIEPHPYSIGYPLFIAPFVFFSKTIHWQTVAKPLVFIQSFFIFPFTIIILAIIFRRIFPQKKGSLEIIAAGVAFAFILYELFVLRRSADPLPFFLFFGLIPYSETLAIFTIILAYGIFILKNFKLKSREAVLVGTLLAFSVLIRITYILFMLPFIFFYLRYISEKKEGLYLFGSFLIAYSPQFLYNWIAYGNPLTSGYFWYWEHIKEQYVEIVKNIYHTNKVQMFSAEYLKTNILLLFKKYIHFLITIIFGFASLFLNRTEIPKNKFLIIVSLNISSLLYLIVILSYLWSPYTHCIDRFLLPLAFLMPIIFFFSISFYAKQTKQN